MMLTLDVIVPTYNRRDLLRRTIESVQRAAPPREMKVSILVVDNNCQDGTAAMVESMAAHSPVPLHCVRETKQGLSNARNGGLAASQSELVGFIDDDEEIRHDWLQVVEREFQADTVEFIGGPYLPRWGAEPPAWLPPSLPAVIGVVPPGSRAPYDDKFPGMLMGGNAVLRRSVFERVGAYNPTLGRTNKGLLSMEDDEFYRRLLRAGVRGMHVPDLVIEHYIPPARLTRRYHRSWCYWHAVTAGFLDVSEPSPVVHLAGIPRHMIGEALRSALRVPGLWLAGRKSAAFEREMALWRLAGFIYGRYCFRPAAAANA